jgi:hypothetical protein
MELLLILVGWWWTLLSLKEIQIFQEPGPSFLRVHQPIMLFTPRRAHRKEERRWPRLRKRPKLKRFSQRRTASDSS